MQLKYAHVVKFYVRSYLELLLFSATALSILLKISFSRTQAILAVIAYP